MADILKVYQGENVVAEAERAEDGTATVTIDGLDPSTEYPAGTYQLTFNNDAGYSAKVDVPAFTTKDISVTGVTVAQEAHEVEVGGTTQINATVEPSNATYKAVSYESSDDSVATVDDNGVVTGVAAGSADITVESLADGSKTAVSTVTVTDATPDEPQNVSTETTEDSADVSAE